ncbi:MULTISPECIES: hypothetical protein [unclassified Cyanobium]|uniref:hypothetical protein n=1 Tax=unclassified Cyanobium TaxID=2627006 RepID=UPI0020CBFB65|nr:MULTISPECIES: hypothetical protein [unclassified Cyanobium]MCP9834330.1 hypothetical protein [Cyanobium sp. La Preciosa 7G6]MCP9937034.1 hypothetical protein [Cyanobium sp. Aljojuca 7A6]
MTTAKILDVGRLWSAALVLSTLLAAAAVRWPRPLPILPAVVAALVLGPPLLLALVVLLRWRLPAADQGGECPEATESVATAQERH